MIPDQQQQQQQREDIFKKFFAPIMVIKPQQKEIIPLNDHKWKMSNMPCVQSEAIKSYVNITVYTCTNCKQKIAFQTHFIPTQMKNFDQHLKNHGILKCHKQGQKKKIDKVQEELDNMIEINKIILQHLNNQETIIEEQTTTSTITEYEDDSQDSMNIEQK